MTTATKPMPGALDHLLGLVIAPPLPQLASCVECERRFQLITARQALAWHLRAERCPRCGGAS